MRTHWSSQLVGLPYEKGDNDCASFCVKAVKLATGKDIIFPSARAHSWRGYTEQITAAKDAIAEQTLDPKDGDGVLMIGRGRLNHIGVFCDIRGGSYVLHAMEVPGQVVLHAIHALSKINLRVEGYYTWK